VIPLSNVKGDVASSLHRMPCMLPFLARADNSLDAFRFREGIMVTGQSSIGSSIARDGSCSYLIKPVSGGQLSVTNLVCGRFVGKDGDVDQGWPSEVAVGENKVVAETSSSSWEYDGNLPKEISKGLYFPSH
jgi:hypothetical protein